MTESQRSAVTMRLVLFDGADAAEALTQTLGDRGTMRNVSLALAKLPQGLADDASVRVGEAAAEVLDLDLIDVLSLGWRKLATLQAAAHRTLDDPGSEEIVDLVTHRITSAHEPRVEVLIDEVPAITIHFRIDLSITLRAVRAVVMAGRLVALTSGKADLRAELSCEGMLIKSAGREIDLPLELRLGEGLLLLERPEPAAEQSP